MVVYINSCILLSSLLIKYIQETCETLLTAAVFSGKVEVFEFHQTSPWLVVWIVDIYVSDTDLNSN